MGYYSNKKIAKVTEPKEVSLSKNPNFVLFTSLKSTDVDSYFTASIFCKPYAFSETMPDSENKVVAFSFNFPNPTVKYDFVGTCTKSEVNISTFFIPKKGEQIQIGDNSLTQQEALSITAQNICDCLKKNTFLRNNYEISVKSQTLDNGIICETSEVLIKAKGRGIQYNFDIISSAADNENSFFEIFTQKVASSDTIDRGLGNARIDIDIYRNTETIMGEDRDALCTKGNYLTTLSKSYFGQPLWFDLNNLMDKKVGYLTPFFDANKWMDIGTSESFRFVAKRYVDGNNQAFFYSDPLYLIKGGSTALSEVSLSNKDESGRTFILDFATNSLEPELEGVKPLTSNFTRTHIKGQSQYFNFLARNVKSRLPEDAQYPNLALCYDLYTQSGNFINSYLSHQVTQNNLHTINGAKLDMDRCLPVAKDEDGIEKTVGRIEVYLCWWHQDENLNIDITSIKVSSHLTFCILPDYIYAVNDFAFLNSLGGWDSVNLGGGETIDYKTSASTIFKTLQPNYKNDTQIEAVAFKSIQEQKIVQSSPIRKEQVEWLKELSASDAVFELQSQKYIIIDDLSLRYTTNEELYRIEMKYHYTDSSK